DGLARAPHDRLVHRGVHPPERPPPEPERTEPIRQKTLEARGALIGTAREDRRVRSDAFGVPAAEQAADGLAGRLAEQIPQRDVDAADGVGQDTPQPAL